MQNATSTRLSLRLPIEDFAQISARALGNESDLLSHVAARIGQKLVLTGLCFELPPSYKHLRLTLTLPVAEALKLHQLARSKDQSATDWITALLNEGPLKVLPSREPLSSKKAQSPQTDA
jgi:hypothetical protein